MKQKIHARHLSEENWHALSEQDIYEELLTRPEGLEKEEVTNRLNLYGQNTLPAKEPPTIWAILLNQVLSPIIYILIVAAVLSLIIGEGTDAIFIFLMIGLNSGLGAYQEYGAEKSAAGLQNLLKIKAKVRRGNQEFGIPSEQVVPGDILLFESGNKVPADLRLIQAQNLTVDESFLTGESISVEKNTELQSEDVRVSDRKNMLYAGSTITKGRGAGIVVATGNSTQVGIIAKSVSESEGGKPPLVLRMEKFVKQISILVLLVSVGLGFLLRYQGYDLLAIFFFVVALAVSAIPEGLPVALTVALSIATKRMSKRNVIVRKLTAVESLGSCTIIASDKTGTLTVNQQTARKIILPGGREFSLTGEGYNGEGKVLVDDQKNFDKNTKKQLEDLAKLTVFANEARLYSKENGWDYNGDAMDVAFLAMAYKMGLNPEDIRNETQFIIEIPYESEQKFSAAFYKEENIDYVAVKGAVETVLDFCNIMKSADNIQTSLNRQLIEKQAVEMAEQGLRVLAVAGGEVSQLKEGDDYGVKDLKDLFFYGLVGFIDPLRPEAAESVRKCKRAGIKVIMITGDHPSTAGAIARELGLMDLDEEVVTGQQLKEVGTLDSPAFEKLVLSTHVFARVTPTQKLEIVEALIHHGEFVAVTGDGVNDAPALRRANIGVAMGSGTDVAKEVGMMIVTDDNFASIVSGVEEGRFAYDNVRKVIYLLISTGAAEVIMLIFAILTGLPIPLLAVQLLWLNLVTNGIQDVALAFEAGEPGAMRRKPRKPNEKIFDSQMMSQTLVSGFAIGALAFASWYWHIRNQMMDEASARNTIMLLMVLLQNVHVFNCRSESVSALKIPMSRNYTLILGVVLAQGIHILSMHLPFMQRILSIEPVNFIEWFIALLLALILLFVMEVFKLGRRRNDKIAAYSKGEDLE